MDIDVYHRPKMPSDPDDKKRFKEQYGKDFKEGDVIKYRLFQIDAREAVAKFPDEYSFMPASAGSKEKEIDKSDPSFVHTSPEAQRLDSEALDPLLDQRTSPSAVSEPQRPGESSR